MACDLNGVGLIDPELLFRDVYATATYTDRWHRLANSFRSPVGRGFGTAKLLIRQPDYARLTTKQTDLTLTFRDDAKRSFQFKKLSILSAENVLPSDDRGTASVLLLTLADRRFRYRQVPVSRQYNYRDSETGAITAASQNGGVDWTWQGVVDDLWDKLVAVYTDLPATGPQFPSAPSGTPEGFEFTATDCWTALCDVAFAGGYLLKYDPTLDETTIIDPATAAPPEGSAVYARQWDTSSVVDVDGPLPESVTVSFPRPGRADRFLETVAITGGGPAGTEVLVRNEMPAVEDPVSNTTGVTQRAGFVAAQWRRDWYAVSEQRAVEYVGCEHWCRRAVGYSSYAEWAVYDLGALDPGINLSGGLTTAIASGKLLVEADGDCCGGGGGTTYGLTTYNVTGLVGSTAGTPVGPSQQWLGNASKGINGGAVFISGGETITSFYPIAFTPSVWNSQFKRFIQQDSLTSTAFGSIWPMVKAFSNGGAVNDLLAGPPLGWSDTVMSGVRGVAPFFNLYTVVITGYGINSGSGYARDVVGGGAIQGTPRSNQFVLYGDTRAVTVGSSPVGMASQYVIDDGPNRWYGGTATHNGARYYGGLFIDAVPPPAPPPPTPVTPPVVPPPPLVPPVSPPPPLTPPVVPPVTSPANGGTSDLIGGVYLPASPPPPPPPIAIGLQAMAAKTDLHFWKVFGRLIRTSPDGTPWEITVDNSGNIVTNSITTTPGEA